ncbi:MAG: ROK family protein [Nitrospinota bacterium]|nr:ROK family protein [Nitrospinota bacterium]
MFIGIDIGGTNLKFATFNLSGKIITKGILKTNTNNIEKKIEDFIDHSKENFFRNKDVEGIGICIAGLLDKNKNLLNSPNLQNFSYSSFIKFIKTKFKNIPINIMNDANAAAMGEYVFGFKLKYSSIFLLTLGTGIGGAFIQNGSLWEGSFGTASEIGHTCIEAGGLKCNCGSNGCLESYFSGWAIEKKAKQQAKLYPNSRIGKLNQFSPLDISKLCDSGDKRSKQIWKYAGAYLGIALSNIINLHNPETIILAGGLIKAKNHFLPYSLKECEKLSLNDLFKKTNIKIGKLGIWSGTYGSIQIFAN